MSESTSGNNTDSKGKWLATKAFQYKEIIEEFINRYPGESNVSLALKMITEQPSATDINSVANLRQVIGKVKNRDFNTPSPEDYSKHKGDANLGLGEVFTRGHSDGSKEMSGVSPTEIKSLQDLCAYFNVNPEEWKVEKWECTNYQSHVKLRHYDTNEQSKIGYFRIDDEHNVVDLYRVWARFAPNVEMQDLRFVEKTILDKMLKHAPVYKKIKYEKYKHPTMQEINIFDLHLGKRAWLPETGTEFNLEVACELHDICLDDLINRGAAFDRDLILFPLGNDFFNVDDYHNTTTSGKNVQDEDERWRRTFDVGMQLLVRSIDKLQNIAPVIAPVIPGNHDRQKSQYLGYALEAWYRNNPNVTIDNSPKLRKYVQYGNCLIGLTHGHDENLNELPIIMANEAPEMHATAKFKEWHLGDKHFKKEIKWLTTEEIRGVTIRRLRSLSGTDAWHYRKGYAANVRAAESFIWDKENGLVSMFSANYHGPTDEYYRDRKGTFKNKKK